MGQRDRPRPRKICVTGPPPPPAAFWFRIRRPSSQVTMWYHNTAVNLNESGESVNKRTNNVWAVCVTPYNTENALAHRRSRDGIFTVSRGLWTQHIAEAIRTHTHTHSYINFIPPATGNMPRRRRGTLAACQHTATSSVPSVPLPRHCSKQQPSPRPAHAAANFSPHRRRFRFLHDLSPLQTHPAYRPTATVRRVTYNAVFTATIYIYTHA